MGPSGSLHFHTCAGVRVGGGGDGHLGWLSGQSFVVSSSCRRRVVLPSKVCVLLLLSLNVQNLFLFLGLRRNGGHGWIEENEENTNMWFVNWGSLAFGGVQSTQVRTIRPIAPGTLHQQCLVTPLDLGR